MCLKLYRFFRNLSESDTLFYCLIAIAIISGIILTVSLCDITPATAKDYKPLLDKQSAVIEDFNKVYTYDDADISLGENTIIVTFENNECSINTVFDRDMKYLYTERNDKVLPWLVILFLGFFTCAALSLFLPLLGFLLFLGISNIFYYIYDLREKRAKNPKS